MSWPLNPPPVELLKESFTVNVSSFKSHPLFVFSAIKPAGVTARHSGVAAGPPSEVMGTPALSRTTL